MDGIFCLLDFKEIVVGLKSRWNLLRIFVKMYYIKGRFGWVNIFLCYLFILIGEILLGESSGWCKIGVKIDEVELFDENWILGNFICCWG